MIATATQMMVVVTGGKATGVRWCRFACGGHFRRRTG
jgi:hypothetical protein